MGTRARSLSGGGVKCWGDNTYGQLGDGTSANTRLAPVDVAGVSGASAVVAGGLHTCARSWRRPRVLGAQQQRPARRQLRHAATDAGRRRRPRPRCDVVSGGGTHTCALTVGGGVRCWGGQCVRPARRRHTISAVAPDDAERIDERRHRCRRGQQSQLRGQSAGGGKCWGDNVVRPARRRHAVPAPDARRCHGLAGAVAITASVGGDHTCAIAGGGGAMCWGNNGNGQLGDNSTSAAADARLRQRLASGVAAVTAGQLHTCALTSGGGVKCWGFNGNGQVGDGTPTQRLVPVDVSGLTSGVTAIAAGSTHSCAVERRRRQMLGAQRQRAARRRHA